MSMSTKRALYWRKIGKHKPEITVKTAKHKHTKTNATNTR